METLTQFALENFEAFSLLARALVFLTAALTLFSTIAFYRESKGSYVPSIAKQFARKISSSRPFIIALAFIALTISTSVQLIQKSGSSSIPSEIWAALGILSLTIICILLAVRYAPQKLLITVGAAIAFVFAAFFYEAFLSVKGFIETTQTAPDSST